VKVLVLFDIARAITAGETFSPEILKDKEDKETEADVLACLQRLGHEVEALAVFNDVVPIIERLKTFAPDVVFNLTESFHSDRAHEPNIPALLELMKARYTGARPDGLMLCKDKALAKKVLAYHRVRVPHFVISTEARPLKRLRRFVFPAFVKPVSEESSEGVSKASFARSEEEALERARFIQEKFHCDALIEEYIEGRELYLSVLGNRKLTVFPPREIFFDQVPDDEPKFATFKAKWNDAYRKKWGIQNGPARELPAGLEEKLTRLARKVYRVLKIQGLGRIDVRLTAPGEIVTIEANPNPSLAREDDFAQSAAASGLEYDALIQKILDSAGG
jgi:D-alanine-D-alanine ligase